MPLGTTVTRVRGFGNAHVTGATDPPSDLGILWGLIVDSRRHTAAEVPSPETEEHADWMQWRWQPLNNTPVWDWEVDVKSQRKMEELEETLWLTWSPTGAGLGIDGVTWILSILLKLP